MAKETLWMKRKGYLQCSFNSCVYEESEIRQFIKDDVLARLYVTCSNALFELVKEKQEGRNKPKVYGYGDLQELSIRIEEAVKDLIINRAGKGERTMATYARRRKQMENRGSYRPSTWKEDYGVRDRTKRL